MNNEQQLKLQAFLDGELSEPEAREISSWVAQDAEATALVRELRNTRQAFKISEAPVRLPESREFYWSKIHREIERLEPVRTPAPGLSFFARLRRMLVPVGAAAALVIAGLLAGHQAGWLKLGGAPDMEMTVADSGAFTYHDYASGTTLVWVSYPADAADSGQR